jgi:hypothetical protein
MSVPHLLSNSAGGLGGSPGFKMCPNGEYLTRLYGYTGDNLDQICGECSDGSSLGCYGTKRSNSVPFDFDYGKLEDNNYSFLSHVSVYADNYVNYLEKAGNLVGDYQLIKCPENMHFAGLNVRSGDWVDNLGFACRYNGMAKYTLQMPETGGGLQEVMPVLPVPSVQVLPPAPSVQVLPPATWVNNDSDIVSKNVSYISNSNGYVVNGFYDGTNLTCDPPSNGNVLCTYYDSKGLFDRTLKYEKGKEPKFKVYIPPLQQYNPVDVVPTANVPVVNVVPYATNTNTVPNINVSPNDVTIPPALTPNMPLIVKTATPNTDNTGTAQAISIETIKAKKLKTLTIDWNSEFALFEDGTTFISIADGDVVKCTYVDSNGIVVSTYTFPKGTEPHFNQKKTSSNMFLYILILIAVIICGGAVFFRGETYRGNSS